MNSLSNSSWYVGKYWFLISLVIGIIKTIYSNKKVTQHSTLYKTWGFYVLDNIPLMTVKKKGKQNAVVMVIFRVSPPEVLVAVKVTKDIALDPICLHYM